MCFTSDTSTLHFCWGCSRGEENKWSNPSEKVIVREIKWEKRKRDLNERQGTQLGITFVFSSLLSLDRSHSRKQHYQAVRVLVCLTESSFVGFYSVSWKSVATAERITENARQWQPAEKVITRPLRVSIVLFAP